MECEKKSRGLMTELIQADEVHYYKSSNLESFLEILHEAIQKRRDNEIIKKNFMTIYESVRDSNFEINLERFQKTYKSLCDKYKKDTNTSAISLSVE